MDTLARASTNGSKRSFFESVYDGSVEPLAPALWLYLVF